MKKLIVATLAACCLSAPAWADQVTTLYAGGTSVDAPCAWFQTKDNGATWYGVPFSDAGYQTEWNILQEAHTTQTNNFSFTAYESSACGGQGANRLQISGP